MPRVCRLSRSDRISIARTDRSATWPSFSTGSTTRSSISWLLEIARTFHGFPHDRIDPKTIGELYDRALRERDGEAWDRAGLEDLRGWRRFS